MNTATDQSRARARAQLGMSAPVITVETHLPGGLPGFTLVGLPATAVREARDRVKSAITNCGLDFPMGRVLVNLAPADLAKEGARLDLAIAVSVLSATGQVPFRNVDDLPGRAVAGAWSRRTQTAQNSPWRQQMP
jgi:magnesium chelatase family protein